MTLIYLSFNAYKLNLRFYDKWTIIRKTFSLVSFLSNFGTSISNNSCNRLKYVFEQIISIAAIENLYFAIKINKNTKFYFIWEDLVHFSNVNLS